MRKLGALACGAAVALLVASPSAASDRADQCEKDLRHLRLPAPRVTDAPPPDGLVVQLAVLQRPQDTLTDLPGGTDRPLLRALNRQARTVAVGSARLLGTLANGTSVYVVPAAPASVRLPRSCERFALLRELEKELRRASHELGLAVIQVTLRGKVIGQLAPGSDSLATGSVMFEDVTRRSTTFGGVVPDGVSSVRLTYLGISEPDTEITVPVSGNTWVRTVSKSQERRAVRSGVEETLPDRVAWLDGNGQPVGPKEPT